MEVNSTLLGALAQEIREQIVESWIFPSETEGVRGFWGCAPVMFIGDQPSMSDWLECNEGRRLFYGKLCKYGFQNAHLTDFYKQRGKRSALKNWRSMGLPPDWLSVHEPRLRKEIRLLNPSRIIACSGPHFLDKKRALP